MTTYQLLRSIARMKKDGEDGYIMECDDAVDTLNELIDEARGLMPEVDNLERRL